MNRHLVALTIAVFLTAFSFLSVSVEAHEQGGQVYDIGGHKDILTHCMDEEFLLELVDGMVAGGMEHEQSYLQVASACLLNLMNSGHHGFVVYHPEDAI